MLDRLSGKILHIDFGDCFEVAMTREKFPEKIPFRLTRMLINAMEVSTTVSSELDDRKSRSARIGAFLFQVTGIDGTYRKTCECVMSVLHRNRDSLMAVLEAFVYDPLLNWRLIEGGANCVLGVVPVRSKSSSTPSVSASVSSASDGANSETNAYSEAANNSLNLNPKKQLPSDAVGECLRNHILE